MSKSKSKDTMSFVNRRTYPVYMTGPKREMIILQPYSELGKYPDGTYTVEGEFFKQYEQAGLIVSLNKPSDGPDGKPEPVGEVTAVPDPAIKQMEAESAKADAVTAASVADTDSRLVEDFERMLTLDQRAKLAEIYNTLDDNETRQLTAFIVEAVNASNNKTTIPHLPDVFEEDAEQLTAILGVAVNVEPERHKRPVVARRITRKSPKRK